jgi:uronate dehydrogenase
MSGIPEKPVLLTGASGTLGRVLAGYLGALGWPLRLTDIVAYPDAMYAASSFTPSDLNDGAAIQRLAEGCGTILHFGGVSTEVAFAETLGPNYVGVYHVYEAARRAGARVVFASSNQAVGFHERNTTLDGDAQFLPSGYYGISKAFGELMGRLYWFKHGVENVNLRIAATCLRPTDERMLATWFSYGDLCRLCERATLAPAVGCCVVWAVSNNSRSRRGRDARDLLGWEPLDSADVYAAELVDKVSDNPVLQRYLGMFTAVDYTRKEPPPGPLFGGPRRGVTGNQNENANTT